jgi:undecaprenyl-diphosphatase
MSSLLEVLLLGVIQGLTEFLPVSSDGHLAVGQLLLGMREGNLTVSVILHGGTLLATALFFQRRLRAIASDFFGSITAPRTLLNQDAGRDAWVILLASVPTGIIGLSMKDWVEQWTLSPQVIAPCFLATAALLWSTRSAPVGTGTTINMSGALLVGVMQGVAVMPGISRSAATMAALLWLGVRSERAFELSMLVGLPAVAGAFLLEASHAIPEGQLGADLLAGAAVSFAVGFVALYLLRGLVTKRRLFWFSIYLVPLAIGTYASVYL